MKLFVYLIIILILSNCSANRSVYWCGDHACINKKEKEAYFKKTMTVEVKNLKSDKSKLTSFEKIKKQTNLQKQKKFDKKDEDIKTIKLDEKNEKKRAKELAKLEKINEKKRIKNEKRKIKEKKRLDKINMLKEKKKLKDEKKKAKLLKKEKNKQKIVLKTQVEKDGGLFNTFEDMIKSITKKNMLRPYPDINNIPE